jgi:transposase, IS30 family
VGRPSDWVREVTGRRPLRSPGQPGHRREFERRFWDRVAEGMLPSEAGVAVGVSAVVGSRWFRQGGGMSPYSWPAPSGRYLAFAEREEIALLRVQGKGIREIAAALGRSPSTISRELRRNAATRSGTLQYRASVARWKAELFARRPKATKLETNPRLREYVHRRLSGQIYDADGNLVAGPAVGRWTGRNKPHRADRRWVQACSPEQISNRIKIDFPDDASMRISHEAIYQALYIEGRAGLDRDEILSLRSGRALRMPRARSKRAAWAHVTEDTLISKRPKEANDRAVAGHWEGDLIIGLGRSAIGTLVERKTRYTMLVHLPREEGWGVSKPVKHGPALGGYGASSMNTALGAELAKLVEPLKKSLTWYRGKELSAHAALTEATGVRVYFADPHSPWQRGSDENTNGLLRQYFPKGTDLSRWASAELQAVADTLNNRPRKILKWRTPVELMRDEISSVGSSVASTS